MATPTPLFRLLTPLLQSFHTTTTTPFALRNSVKATSQKPTSQRTFSSSPSHLARGRGKPKADPRITLIRYHLQHPQTPRPLRFSRLRALRHWTIHRAWMLARRKRMESEEGELQRMHKSMAAAMEELRTMDPPGTKNAGRLYRIATEKKGIFGHGGVPIEYARLQTDTPAKEAWNHGWTR